MTLYESRLTAIENYLSTTEYPKEPTNLYDPIRYFMALGGKRIRPLFTVLSAELFGGTSFLQQPPWKCSTISR
ncbi:MAG: hypothetical protein RLZZ68_100 [Bacteroidota bacterium]